MFRRLLTALAAATLFALPARAGDGFYLRGGETVVFFGDSITQAGPYVEYVETYLRTRFPDRSFRIINHGISSETVSGTSEPDHDPPRPDAHDRFARDVAAWRPDVLVACFGMNDGNYHPFAEERFQRYQAGVQRLIDRARDEAGCRLTILTPPPFDPYRRTNSDPEAVSFGYKFPAIDYDQTLERYSQWLVELGGRTRDQALVVADVHAAMNEHLRRRREGRVSFAFSPDAVHPDPTGHWLMAQTLLLAWQAPAECATVRIGAAELASEGDVSNLTEGANGLRFTWRTPLAMPLDPRWDAESIALEQVGDRLNRHRLVVRNLTADRYRLLADGADVAQLSREDLEIGVDLTALADFPANLRAREVLRLVQKRSRLVYSAWRATIAAPPGDVAAAGQQQEADARAAELDAQLRELCRPMTLDIQLVPVPP